MAQQPGAHGCRARRRQSCLNERPPVCSALQAIRYVCHDVSSVLDLVVKRKVELRRRRKVSWKCQISVIFWRHVDRRKIEGRGWTSLHQETEERQASCGDL